MDPIERAVRDEHPDWTDDQVAAEVARIKAANPPAPDPDPDPDPSSRGDAAWARMRRQLADAERRAREAEDREAERQRREAEEQGRWQQLYERERAGRERVEAEARDAAARRDVERAASRLRFIDAGYALYLLEQQGVDLADADAVSARLEQIARDQPHLIDNGEPLPPGPSGGPPAGPPKPQASADEIRKLAKENPAEFNRRFDAGEIPADALGG